MNVDVSIPRYVMIRGLLLRHRAGIGYTEEGFCLRWSTICAEWKHGDECEWSLPLMSLVIRGKEHAEALCKKLNEAKVTRDELVASVLKHIQEDGKKEDPYKREVAITSKEDGCVLAHLRVDFNEKTFEADFDEDVVDVAYAERFKFKPVAVDER